jgi:hypothetical protein
MVSIVYGTIRVYVGGLLLPSPPRLLAFGDGSETLAYDVIARGGIKLPRGFQPSTVRLEGTFYGAARQRLPLVTAWQDPMAVVEELRQWTRFAADLGPRTLSITGVGFSQDVLPESFDWTPKGGYGDVDYRLVLYEARTVEVGLSGAPAGERPGTTRADSGGTVYRTVPHDTLAGVAAAKLGDARRWQEIVEANPGVEGLDQPEIPPGTSLKLPPRDRVAPNKPIAQEPE